MLKIVFVFFKYLNKGWKCTLPVITNGHYYTYSRCFCHRSHHTSTWEDQKNMLW